MRGDGRMRNKHTTQKCRYIPATKYRLNQRAGFWMRVLGLFAVDLPWNVRRLLGELCVCDVNPWRWRVFGSRGTRGLESFEWTRRLHSALVWTGPFWIFFEINDNFWQKFSGNKWAVQTLLLWCVEGDGWNVWESFLFADEGFVELFLWILWKVSFWLVGLFEFFCE